MRVLFARKAAAQLHAAGVRTVLWLEADMLGDAGAGILCDVIAPALRAVQSGAGAIDAGRQLDAALRAHNLPGAGGCVSVGEIRDWAPPPGAAGQPRVVDLLPAAPARVGLGPASPALRGLALLSCDLERLDELRYRSAPARGG